jgi:hypothetical protein
MPGLGLKGQESIAQALYVFSAIGRLVVKIFAGCYFPLASGKMTRY